MGTLFSICSQPTTDTTLAGMLSTLASRGVPSLFSVVAEVVLSNLAQFPSYYAKVLLLVSAGSHEKLAKKMKGVANMKKLMTGMKKALLRHACLTAVLDPPGNEDFMSRSYLRLCYARYINHPDL